MLIVDAQSVNPLAAFYIVRKNLEKLKGITSASIFKRKNEESILHNLKKFDDYIDAIYRFSYHAKTKSKAEVPLSFKRTFGSSPINDKYFYIYEDIMKPKIVLANKNDSLTFVVTNDKIEQQVNFRYLECRKSTYCFHLQDRKTSQNIGFLGLYIETEDLEGEIHLYIHVESVYIKPEFRGNKFSLLFINELSLFASKAMADCKLKLKPNQKLIVMNTTSQMACGSDMFVSMIEDNVSFLCKLNDLEQM